MRAVAWQICQRISIGNSCNPDEQRSSSLWYWIINNLVAIPTTTYHLHHHTIISVFKKAVKYFFYTIYRVIFAVFLPENGFAPPWIRPNKVLNKAYRLKHRNSPSLKFGCCQRGPEECRGEYFPLYSILIAHLKLIMLIR